MVPILLCHFWATLYYEFSCVFVTDPGPEVILLSRNYVLVYNDLLPISKEATFLLLLYSVPVWVTIRRFDYDTIRYDDTTTHSTTSEVIEITICVRFDCHTTTRLRRKLTC